MPALPLWPVHDRRLIMAKIAVNGIELTYEISGKGDPLLLIMGLGGQLTDWPQPFVELLAEHFSVIRFDNRDTGLSTYSDAPTPTRWDLVRASVRPSSVRAPYSLDDLATDAACLLRGLGIDGAHVVGTSMGAMIAQRLTIANPELVLSLCSIMSNTGSGRNGQPTARVLANLARRGEPDRSDALETTMALFKLVGGRDWSPADQRERSEASIARAYNPAGVLRQSLAIATTPDRTAELAQVVAPTLVIHGLDDVLVRPSGGKATARAIPGSRLLMFPRMGHDLSATRHHEMVQAIATNARR